MFATSPGAQARRGDLLGSGNIDVAEPTFISWGSRQRREHNEQREAPSNGPIGWCRKDGALTANSDGRDGETTSTNQDDPIVIHDDEENA